MIQGFFIFIYCLELYWYDEFECDVTSHIVDTLLTRRIVNVFQSAEVTLIGPVE